MITEKKLVQLDTKWTEDDGTVIWYQWRYQSHKSFSKEFPEVEIPDSTMVEFEGTDGDDDPCGLRAYWVCDNCKAAPVNVWESWCCECNDQHEMNN